MDLDPHKSEESDPDPHQSEESDLDPHQSEQRGPDPDPHHFDTDPQHWLAFPCVIELTKAGNPNTPRSHACKFLKVL